MKRYTLLHALLVVSLVFLCSANCFAVFPKPDGTIRVQMFHGWYDDDAAWYISTDTSNIRFATTQHLTLAPKILSAIETTPQAADDIYMVTNFNNNGPVFGSAPPEVDYTPLWHVSFVTWINPFAARVITNPDPASPTNPTGLPGPNEAIITPSDIVFDCPIMARGSLGGPWLPAPNGGYRIPQGKNPNSYTKTLELPTWLVYCADKATTHIERRSVIIPDTDNPTLSAQLGANIALPLANMPLSDTQNFWFIQGIVPASQYPIIQDCPNGETWRNTNFDYSPIMVYTILNRNIPPNVGTVVNNPTLLQILLGSGKLSVLSNNQIINAPVIELDDAE